MSPNPRGDSHDTGEWMHHRVAILMTLEDIKARHDKLEKEIDGTREALHTRLSRNADHAAARHNSAVAGFSKRLRTLELELTQLKTKAMMWGAVAGFILTLITSVIGTLISVWLK